MVGIDYSTMDQAPGRYIDTHGAVDPGNGYNNNRARLRPGFGSPGDYVRFGENIYVVGTDMFLTPVRTNLTGQIIQRSGNVTAHDPRNLAEPNAPVQASYSPTATQAIIKTGSPTGFVDTLAPSRSATVNAPTLLNGAPNKQYNPLLPTRYEVAPVGPTGVTPQRSFSFAPEGVYATNRGEQIIVTEGPRPKNAGELLGRLQGKTFKPVISGDSPNSPLSNRQVFVLNKGEKIIKSSKDESMLPVAPEGVYATNRGEQIIVTEGPRPKNAGELLGRLQGKTFKPTRITPDVTYAVQAPRTLHLLGMNTGVKLPETYGSDYFAAQATDALQHKDYLGVGAYTGTAFLVGNFEGLTNPITDTPGFITSTKNLVLHPIKSAEALYSEAKANPGGTAGQFTGGLLLFKGVGKLGSTAYRAGEAGITRLSPNYVPAETVPGESSLVLKDVPTSKGPVDIMVVREIGSASLPTDSLRTQALRAGTTVNAVSGARNLFSTFKGEITVDKPLPTPDANPIERSFFYDPEARLRPSRLGLTQATTSATLSDIATGNFKVFRDTPQAIITPQLPIEAFPGYLSGVQNKLLRNKPLNPAEETAFLQFQLTPSGKAKPVGFISGEPEVTLAPGETIRRVRGQGGVTLLQEQGRFIPRRVSIIEAEVVGGTANPIADATGFFTRRRNVSSNLFNEPYLSPERASVPALAIGAASYSFRGKKSSSDFSAPSRLGGGSYLEGASVFGASSPVRASRFDVTSALPGGGSANGGSKGNPRGGGSPSFNSPIAGRGGSPSLTGISFALPKEKVELPPIDVQRKGREKKSGTRSLLDVSFKNTYAPSLVGGFFNVRGTKRSATIAEVTGIGIRPVTIV